MANSKMKKSRLRATLRGLWWTSKQELIRHCFVCGEPLKKKLVPADKKKRLVCIDCGHITYLNPRVVAGFIPLTSDGRVALLRREIEPARGKWSYPAGYQEIGETVEAAAVRETWEEIRSRASITGLVGIYSYADAGVVTIVYHGKLKRGERPRPGIESQDVKLFRPSQIPWKELAFRSTRHALQDWMKQR